MNSEDIKNLARKFGADLVGIASIERFNGVPLQLHPASILPECKSIIVVGYQVVRGALRGIEESLLYRGYDFASVPVSDYERFGRVHVEDTLLASTVYNIACSIEDEGWEAVPIFPYPPEAWPQGVSVAPGRVAPNVHPDPEFAAVAAGLGEIGYNNILLTPEFGPRQRLQLILTELPLKPDPVLEGKICDLCMKCVDICPFGAISRDKRSEVVIAGKKMIVGNVEYVTCNRCPNGARPNRFHEAGKPDRLAALCNRTCIAHLEEIGALKIKFSSPFRRRKPQILDLEGKPITKEQ
ncbi:MAG: 4Fe-4S binding protein [Candidatus Bathyarchaeota archaeon]|nr:4Fe-4S binding protein [Candidatus Bathyarchaeota archaeon]